jgi:zinc transporter ZupT
MVPLKMVASPFSDNLNWIIPLLSLAAAVVCLVFRKISGRLLLVMAAFLLDCMVYAAMRLTAMLEVDGSLPSGQFVALITYANFARIAIGLLLVVGLAATFADVHRKLSQATKARPGNQAPDHSGYPDHDAG